MKNRNLFRLRGTVATAIGVVAIGTLAIAAGAAEQLPGAEAIDAQRHAIFDAPAVPVTGDKRMPSDARIRAEQAKGDAQRKEVFGDTKPAPNVFPNVQAPEPSRLDPMSIARQYQAQATQMKQEELLAFASLSMPPESLKRMIRDTARAGGVVVLRGFKDHSFKATAAAIQTLGVKMSSVQINPNAFKQYKVTTVPAWVLVKADRAMQLDDEGCALPANFAGVSGDTTLAYALDAIAQRASNFASLANRLRASVGGH